MIIAKIKKSCEGFLEKVFPLIRSFILEIKNWMQPF